MILDVSVYQNTCWNPRKLKDGFTALRTKLFTGVAQWQTWGRLPSEVGTMNWMTPARIKNFPQRMELVSVKIHFEEIMILKMDDVLWKPAKVSFWQDTKKWVYIPLLHFRQYWHQTHQKWYQAHLIWWWTTEATWDVFWRWKWHLKILKNMKCIM